MDVCLFVSINYVLLGIRMLVKLYDLILVNIAAYFAEILVLLAELFMRYLQPYSRMIFRLLAARKRLITV